MTSALDITRRLGGVARVTDLRAEGATESSIRRLVSRGALRRIRKGWVGLPDAPTPLVGAVQLGGRPACVTAAKHHGLWTPDDDRFHLARPAHSGRCFGDATGAVEHWQSAAWRDRASAVESVPAVIRQVLLCLPRELALTIIDSALHQGQLGHEQLEEIVFGLPQRYASVMNEVEPLAESGLETLCRVRLAALGVRIRSQVHIDGVGRVALVIGDRLVLEADGREWHDGSDVFHRDRTRDLALARRGYLVIRVDYTHVVHEWQLVELAVMAIVGRREHLWSAQHRRAGLAL